MKCVYPAVFTWNDKDKVYLVNFPDIEGCFTFGYTLTEALDNANDVLPLMLSDDDPIPKASKLEDIKIEDKNSFVQYVYADTELYRDLLQLRKILEIKKKIKAKKIRRNKKTEANL